MILFYIGIILNGCGAYIKFPSITNIIIPVFKKAAINAAVILLDLSSLFVSYPILTISLSTIYYRIHVDITINKDIPGRNSYLVSMKSLIYWLQIGLSSLGLDLNV